MYTDPSGHRACDGIDCEGSQNPVAEYAAETKATKPTVKTITNTIINDHQNLMWSNPQPPTIGTWPPIHGDNPFVWTTEIPLYNLDNYHVEDDGEFLVIYGPAGIAYYAVQTASELARITQTSKGSPGVTVYITGYEQPEFVFDLPAGYYVPTPHLDGIYIKNNNDFIVTVSVSVNEVVKLNHVIQRHSTLSLDAQGALWSYGSSVYIAVKGPGQSMGIYARKPQ